jgi:hypothetical protein
MAHYMALRGSRFRFSHPTTFLPCHGIEQMISDAPMIMRYRFDGKKQVACHVSMDYLYRPTAMADLCAYQFYSTLQSTSKSDARKTFDAGDIYTFIKGHPMWKTDAVTYRAVSCVPIWNWKWLGSTRNFDSSLLAEVSHTHADYVEKETYARRFMILFMPFRNASDLQINNSHQKALQAAITENRIPEAMFAIAENIQTIHNSLESSMPENILTSETEFEEDDLATNGDDDRFTNSLEDMLTSIGGILSSTSNGAGLKEDCANLVPKYAESRIADINEDATMDISSAVFENVIETVVQEKTKPAKPPPGPSDVRFKVKTSTLNTYVSHRFLTSSERLNEHGEPTGETENHVDATGSWQSIVAWGIKAELDPEQQTAFSILAATYVLTFYDDAEKDFIGAGSYDEQYKALSQLARKHESRIGPLRMFITGPAGAGKCKSIVVVALVSVQLQSG